MYSEPCLLQPGRSPLLPSRREPNVYRRCGIGYAYQALVMIVGLWFTAVSITGLGQHDLVVGRRHAESGFCAPAGLGGFLCLAHAKQEMLQVWQPSGSGIAIALTQSHTHCLINAGWLRSCRADMVFLPSHGSLCPARRDAGVFVALFSFQSCKGY